MEKLCFNFPQILGLDAARDVIATRIQSKKGCFSVEKQNEQPCVLIMPDLQELHWTNEPKAERILATRFGYVAQTVYLLGPEPRAALDHATPLYTALGDTVKKAVSITSLSNLVRSIQIRHRILLKLRISEQTPLMWKPGKNIVQ